jgi:hypothetical protein
MKKSKEVCPHGHRDGIVPIIYGIPAFETMKDAEKGKCKLGGCI